jgi:hypothetical protein
MVATCLAARDRPARMFGEAVFARRVIPRQSTLHLFPSLRGAPVATHSR